MTSYNFYLIGFALLAACAPAKEGAKPAALAAGSDPIDTVCFTSGISGFREAGGNKLIIRRSPGEAYIISTGFCPNLQSAEGLKIDDPGQCLSRGSRLRVYDTPLPLKGAAADRPDHCLVTEIRELREAYPPQQ